MVQRDKRHFVDTGYYFINATQVLDVPSASVVPRPREAGGVVTHDGPCPNYRWKLRHKQPATTELAFVGTNWDIGFGLAKLVFENNFSLPNNKYHFERSGCLTDPFAASFGSADLSVADDLAKVSAVQSANRALQSFSGGTFLGELRETLGMIHRPAVALRQGLSRYLSALKKRRRRSKKTWKGEAARVASGLWLEYAYGWSPLMSDIDNGMAALTHLQSGKPSSAPFRGFGSNSVGPVESVYTNSVQDLSWKVRSTQRADAFVVYKGEVSISLPGERFSWRQDLGFTLNDFVPTVWELIPYSFLVDYFTNIGDILSAMSFASSSIAWVQKTTVRETRCVQQAFEPNFGSLSPPTFIYKNKTFNPGRPSTVTTRNIVRTAKNISLVPSLRFEVPGFGSSKWINLAALGEQHRSLTPY